MDTYPAMLNKLFGTKMKVIGGYKAGTDIYLAMERGEVDGRCGGAAHRRSGRRGRNWLTERKIHVPILIAEKRSAAVPGHADRAGVRARTSRRAGSSNS